MNQSVTIFMMMYGVLKIIISKFYVWFIGWKKSSNFLNTGLVSGIKRGVFVEAHLCVNLVPNKSAMIVV